MKKMSSFRLDPLAASRLEQMAKSVGLSQSNFIEQLADAALNSYLDDWKVDFHFDNFCRSMRDRTALITKGESPE